MMKKTLFTLLIIGVTSVSAFSQMSGGLKAGVNLASQKYSAGGDSETYSGTNFHIGGYFNYAISDVLSLQPELLYNSVKVDLDGEDFTTNYLSVPVMVVYGFSDNKFNVQVGPQIGFLMSTDPSEVKDADWYKGTDFTLNLGAGANFGKFNITARYGLGLSNIAGDFWDGSGIEIKNNVIQFSVGYKLFGE